MKKKTYAEYKDELDEIIIQINNNKLSFEEISQLYQQAHEIIQILKHKLESQEHVISKIISEDSETK